MRGRLRVLVVALAIPISGSGCGGHSPPASRVDRDAAKAFGARLIDVLERDDVTGFSDLLSARMQLQGDVVERFASWRAELVPYAQALRESEWTVAYHEARPVVRFRAMGRTPESLAHVVDERGALRIDE
jgi:hypothetical protein